jgi:integrase
MRTEREVAAFARANRGRRAELSVGGAAGLVARVARDGEVSYAVRYRNRGGQQRTLTLGPLSLAKAREHAQDLLAQARVGTDPWEERRAERLADEERRRASDRTLTAVAEAWFASREAAAWRPSTRRETERLVRRHLLAAFGERDPNTLERGEVRKLLDDLAEETPSEANHAFAAFRALYNWLRRDRQEHLGVTAHPLLGLERPARVVPRDRTYTDEEVRRIFTAVPAGTLGDLVALLFHTGTRDGETRAARWADVDLDRGVWTIPAERSKNRRPHQVALSSGALAVLRRRPRFGEYVFPNPATRTGYVERDQKALSAASHALGFALRLHDVRRTVGDRLRAQFGEAVMHAALGHADATLTRTYGPTPRLRATAEALEWWAGELARILGAAEAEVRA